MWIEDYYMDSSTNRTYEKRILQYDVDGGNEEIVYCFESNDPITEQLDFLFKNCGSDHKEDYFIGHSISYLTKDEIESSPGFFLGTLEEWFDWRMKGNQ